MQLLGPSLGFLQKGPYLFKRPFSGILLLEDTKS